jgi:hydrogenase assembly chaperone HypC/HupF
MCLGFPGLVVAVDATGATIETEGRRRRASTLLAPDLAIGEWVFVAAGTVIDRVSPEDAAFIRASLFAAMTPEPAGPRVRARHEVPR